MPGIPFVLVESPYRPLVRPFVRYLQVAHGQIPRRPDRAPPPVRSRHWWERFLYNENGERIKQALVGRSDILVAQVPYARET